MSKRILISGASIAGNTAAFWLGKLGFDVTVVEKWPDFRKGGQNIDVRDVGRDVLRRMGLDEAALDRGTKEEGTAWIDHDGEVVAEFVTEDLGADGPTAELEILRGDLAELIYDAAKDRCDFRFGDSIAEFIDHADRVEVTFQSGRIDSFDAVIIAEGVGSASRELVFPGENEPRWMDLTIAYFTIPRASDDDRMWRWYNTTHGRSISLRPDDHGTARAMLSIRKPHEGEQDWNEEQQRAFLRDQFKDAGWQADRVLAGLDQTDDFYFDVLRQVRLENWSKGRIALLGDAAWCATPMAGIGATLAVTGAYVLAQELARNADIETAFSRYEQAMRPMVEDGQGVPKFGIKMMNPQTSIGIKFLHAALHLASTPPLRKVMGTAFSRKLKTPDLDVYAT
ncbi:FAD-dependent monooxygenase [Devosia sp. BK]|uniref:FAD-dependent monooxygenase n=1 Tax=Devosia sp. BK TaxID=2871706 RepID=UPI00293B8286|nr:FAD-dependent monooxygenase [Devosia sp. BK]MDV3253246.1 FAD-dependent monooxygenase [Devosia sp. BK]